jgi:hypothetical protein
LSYFGGLAMDESLESLAQIGREINAAMVRVGRADWRREFNVRLWSCNRDRALALTAEYRAKLMRLVASRGLDQARDGMLSPVRR